MAEPVFFAPPAPLTIAEIAELTGARVAPGVDLDMRIGGFAGLDRAGPADISFCESGAFLDALAATRAGACFTTARLLAGVPRGTIGLETPAPHRAFAVIGAKLYPAAIRPDPVTGERGLSPAAHIDERASLESGVTVEAGAVIAAGAEIGRGSVIGPCVVIGAGVRIGRDVSVGSGASIAHALIGNRVLIHPGVCIGRDGFGFVPGASGHTKVAQTGRVVIQDDVEIGANSTIDRGGGRDTIIGEGTKIDNLVQIGHNVFIGRHCLIAGQVGISGSVTVGDFVMMGGQVGIRDHVTIGNGARIAATAGVAADIPPGEAWAGNPAQPMRQFQRDLRSLKRLTRTHGKSRDGSEKSPSDE